MKKIVLIVLAAVLLLELAASAVLADSSARPFKGRVPGADVWMLGACSDPGRTGVPCLTYEVEGTIIATHLGKGIYASVVSFDFANGEWTPDGAICGELVPESSTFTFVAANGDKLHGSLTGFGCNIPDVRGWGTFQGEFTGGTGRFADAAGTVVKEFTSQPGVVASTWEGLIGY
jgi:hypothetical protein